MLPTHAKSSSPLQVAADKWCPRPFPFTATPGSMAGDRLHDTKLRYHDTETVGSDERAYAMTRIDKLTCIVLFRSLAWWLAAVLLLLSTPVSAASVAEMRQAAKQGDAYAQVILGRSYALGERAPQNYKEA